MHKGFIFPKLIFPVIIRSKDGTTTFYTSEEPLTRVYKKTYEKGLLEGLLITDSSGKEFKVIDVINLGYTNILWGINVFLGQEIYVELKLQLIRELTLDEFKAIALKIIKNNGDYFLSADRHLNKMNSMVANAKTSTDVIQILVGE